MKRRRAVSLVELLLAMSACTVILTMSAALLHRGMHAQSKTRAFVDVERNAWRLGTLFRQDVHQASTAQIMDQGDGVVLRLEFAEDRTIEYRRSEDVITRVVLAGDAVKAREEFSFPAEAELTVRRESQTIALSIVAPPGNNAYSVPVSIQVVARVSRDRQFSIQVDHDE